MKSTHRAFGVRDRRLVAAAIGAVVMAGTSGTADARGAATTGDVTTTVRDVATHYAWGYRGGVKQPLGAFLDGLSVHQISRSEYPVTTDGNPDYVLFVDERTGTQGVRIRPTGAITANAQNPGGMVGFSTLPPEPAAAGAPGRGTIWYTTGARFHEIPLELYRSRRPFDASAFDVVLDDAVVCSGCTTPCLSVHSPKLLLFYRNGWSNQTSTTVRFRRYDERSDGLVPELQRDLARGWVDPQSGTNYGIEQLWTRFDPRFGYTFVTWQWFRLTGHLFGSNAFLYTDDDGDTWRRADGAPVSVPLDYADRDAILVPDDHLARGDTTNWHVRDIGVTPNGTFFMTLPVGDPEVDDASAIVFWRFDGSRWQGRKMTGRLGANAKPHACGVTRDYVVFVHSESDETLLAQISADDGVTWTDPVPLDVVTGAAPGDPQKISWVSFVQPADGYPDNTARFFYAHYNSAQGNPNFERNYRNRIKWIRVDVNTPTIGAGEAVLPPPCPGDLDGTHAVEFPDLLALLANWGPCGGCPADLDASGAVDFADLLAVLSAWGPC